MEAETKGKQKQLDASKGHIGPYSADGESEGQQPRPQDLLDYSLTMHNAKLFVSTNTFPIERMETILRGALEISCYGDYFCQSNYLSSIFPLELYCVLRYAVLSCLSNVN